MRKHVLIIGILLLLIFSASNPIIFGSNVKTIDEKEVEAAVFSEDSPIDSPRPMFQHDARNTGRSPYGKPGNWRVEKWKFRMDGLIKSSPAVDKDGVVYIGSLDWYFFAVNPNGTEKWHFKTNGGVHSSPAIGKDGTIYFGSDDGKLYALYPNGTKKWSLGIGSDWIYSSPVIDEDGIIYATSLAGNICGVYPNGTKKWDTHLGGWIYCNSPGIDNNGVVYCGDDCRMYAVYTSNGTIKWKYGTVGAIGSAPTIDDDGTIYFGSNDGYLYALNPNGTLKWRFLTKKNYGLTSSPAIAMDGSLIVGSGLGYVYSLNPNNGSENWRFNAGADVASSPAIDKYGVIYFGNWDGMFYALNPDGSLKWKFKGLDYIIPSPAIGEDGTIYFASHLSSQPDFYIYLYAIEPVEDDPPEKPSLGGPNKGRIGTEYTFTAVTTDPDGDNISYLFDWDDGTTSGWTEYVPTGTPISRNHTWEKIGVYTVKCKARDPFKAESPWVRLVLIMPRNKVVYNSLLLWFLEQFLCLKQLLNLI